MNEEIGGLCAPMLCPGICRLHIVYTFLMPCFIKVIGGITHRSSVRGEDRK